MGEDVLSVLPRIPLVWDETMEHPNCYRYTPTLSIFDGSRNRRNVGETLFCQKTADLQVWIDSPVEASEKLEDESVLEDDRGIALLGLEG